MPEAVGSPPPPPVAISSRKRAAKFKSSESMRCLFAAGVPRQPEDSITTSPVTARRMNSLETPGANHRNRRKHLRRPSHSPSPGGEGRGEGGCICSRRDSNPALNLHPVHGPVRLPILYVVFIFFVWRKPNGKMRLRSPRPGGAQRRGCDRFHLGPFESETQPDPSALCVPNSNRCLSGVLTTPARIRKNESEHIRNYE